METRAIQGSARGNLSWKLVILVVSLGTLLTVWGAILFPVGAQSGSVPGQSQGNPQVLVEIEAMRVDLNTRIDLLETSLKSELASLEQTLSGGIVSHDSKIDGHLDDHDDDLADHDSKIDGHLDDHDSDLADAHELIRSTHLIDPLDMQVTVCGSASSDADFDHTTHLEQDFAYGPGIGVDAYGNGAQVDWMAQFDNGLYADVGAQTGLAMNACLNGIFIRADGTVEGATTDLTDLTPFLNETFGDQADLTALRAKIAELAQDLQKPLTVETVTNSLNGLGEIDMDVNNPFQLVHDDLKDLSKELPFTRINEKYWPDSPIDAMFVSLDPVALICSPDVKSVFASASTNPIEFVCANNSRDLITPLEKAFKDFIPGIEEIVSDIEDIIEDVEDDVSDLLILIP
jgi:hypothetical protein